MPKGNPVMYMMVGLPGSGKSTHVRKIGAPFVSSDYYIEKWAKEQGKTYNEIFKESVKQAMNSLREDVEFMLSHDGSFIWDQTNLTKKVREERLSKIPAHYKKIAVVIDAPINVCLERNQKRDRSIPEHIIKSMYMTFELPSLDEGFDEIKVYDETGELVDHIIKGK